MGGVQIGFNYQISNFVLGAETDFAFSGIESDDTVTSVQLGGTSTVQIKHEKEHIGTVRARLGYGVDRFLPFVSGGLAYGKNTSSGVATNSGFTSPYESFNGTFTGSDSKYHEGYG